MQLEVGAPGSHARLRDVGPRASCQAPSAGRRTSRPVRSVFDGRLGSPPVCQDRGAGRCARRAAAGARPARPSSHARRAALRGSRRGEAIDRFVLPLLGRRQEVGIREARSSHANVNAVLVDRPCSTIARRSTASAATTTRTTRAGLRSCRAPRSSSPRGGRQPSTSCTRTTGRPGSRPSTCGPAMRRMPRLARCATIFTIHNLAYQGLCPADWLPPLGLDSSLLGDRRARVLGPASACSRAGSISPTASRPSARPTRGRSKPRNTGSGSRAFWPRRAADLSGILNGIDTDQWDPGTRSASAGALRRDDGRRGKRAAKRRAARALPAAGRCRDAAAAARRHGFAPGRSEGLRPPGAAGRRLGRPRRDVRRARAPASPRYEKMWRDLAAAHPGRGRRQDRIRRAAGAPDRGRRRHLPDAVAVRALRAEPDVQPCATARCRSCAPPAGSTTRLSTIDPSAAGRAPDSSSRPIRPRRCSGRSSGRGRPSLTRESGRRLQVARHAAGLFLGPIGPRVRQTI